MEEVFEVSVVDDEDGQQQEVDPDSRSDHVKQLQTSESSSGVGGGVRDKLAILSKKRDLRDAVGDGGGIGGGFDGENLEEEEEDATTVCHHCGCKSVKKKQKNVKADNNAQSSTMMMESKEKSNIGIEKEAKNAAPLGDKVERGCYDLGEESELVVNLDDDERKSTNTVISEEDKVAAAPTSVSQSQPFTASVVPLASTIQRLAASVSSVSKPTPPVVRRILPKWQIRDPDANKVGVASPSTTSLKRGYDGTVDPECSKIKRVTLKTKDGPVDVSTYNTHTYAAYFCTLIANVRSYSIANSVQGSSFLQAFSCFRSAKMGHL